MSRTDSIVRLLASRGWAAVLVMLAVLGTALAVEQFDAARLAANALHDAQAQRDDLRAEVADLRAADPRPNALDAWKWLATAVARHGAVLAAGTDDADFQALTQGMPDAWIGIVSGETADTLRAIDELAPVWPRYRPLALRIRDGHCAVLVAVMGRSTGATPKDTSS